LNAVVGYISNEISSINYCSKLVVTVSFNCLFSSDSISQELLLIMTCCRGMLGMMCRHYYRRTNTEAMFHCPKVSHVGIYVNLWKHQRLKWADKMLDEDAHPWAHA